MFKSITGVKSRNIENLKEKILTSFLPKIICIRCKKNAGLETKNMELKREAICCLRTNKIRYT